MSGRGTGRKKRRRAAILVGGVAVAGLLGAGSGHSTSQRAPWEIIVAVAAAVVVIVVFILAIKFLVSPGERAPGHIKRSILDDSAERPRSDE